MIRKKSYNDGYITYTLDNDDDLTELTTNPKYLTGYKTGSTALYQNGNELQVYYFTQNPTQEKLNDGKLGRWDLL